jgi:hypothetical protein
MLIAIALAFEVFPRIGEPLAPLTGALGGEPFLTATGKGISSTYVLSVNAIY